MNTRLEKSDRPSDEWYTPKEVAKGCALEGKYVQIN